MIRRLAVGCSLTLGLGLVVVSAEAANPTPLADGCMAEAPHHTMTFDKSDGEQFSSTKAYWDNACGCYIQIINVPSTSAPTSSGYAKSFWLQAETAPTNLAKDVCEGWVYDVYLHKKNAAGKWEHVSSTQIRGSWSPPAGLSGGCLGKWSAPLLNPPTTGSDAYRISMRHTVNGKHAPVAGKLMRQANPH